MKDRKVGKRPKQNGGRCRSVWESKKSAKTTIREKFDRFNEIYKYINQSTRNWTFVQHKRGFTKLLKATNRGFSYATPRKEERLQAWIEVEHFSPNQYNWIRKKPHDNAWQRDLKFPSSIWILQSPVPPLCLRTNRKGKPLNTFRLSSTSSETFVCVLLTRVSGCLAPKTISPQSVNSQPKVE